MYSQLPVTRTPVNSNSGYLELFSPVPYALIWTKKLSLTRTIYIFPLEVRVIGIILYIPPFHLCLHPSTQRVRFSYF